MWLFKRKKRVKVKCRGCGQKLKLLEWEDLGKTLENPPYRCLACNQIFCLNCLDKRRGRSLGNGLFETLLRCPKCDASEIKYGVRVPLPESPEEVVRRKAKEFQAKHGNLVKVHCNSQTSIEFVYQDGTTLDENLEGSEGLVACGYAGAGSTQLHAFLTESGFQISRDEVYDRCLPYVLQRKR